MEQKRRLLTSVVLTLPVYCCCCLANVSLPGIGGTIPESKPFFYVNVADIESLEVEVSYVACEYGALPLLSLCPNPFFSEIGSWTLGSVVRLGWLSLCSLGVTSLILGSTGTTEKIFEEKQELYDVYVDNQNVKTHHDHLQPLLKINSADREKYRRLNEQRWDSCPPATSMPCVLVSAAQASAVPKGLEVCRVVRSTILFRMAL